MEDDTNSSPADADSDAESAVNCLVFVLNSNEQTFTRLSAKKIMGLRELVVRGASFQSLRIRPLANFGALVPLGEAIKRSQSVSEFSVEGCEGDNTEVVARCISSAVAGSSSIETLSLTKTTIQSYEGDKIAEGLARNVALRHVCLPCNRMGGYAATSVCEALERNPALLSLDLASNGIGDLGAKAVARLLLKSHSLVRVNIEQNAIYLQGAVALSEVIRKNGSLQELNMNNNWVADEGVACIADSLCGNRTLRTLKMRMCKISDKGAKSIAEALSDLNFALQELDLADNELNEDGVGLIFGALMTNSTIKAIDISLNTAGNEGAKRIAEVLSVNTSIQRLDMKTAVVADQGLNAIFSSLAKNTSLQDIDLGDNEITESNFSSIGSSLITNTSLRSVSLARMYITCRTAKGIFTALRNNHTVTQLNLASQQKSDIRGRDASALEAAMELSCMLLSNRVLLDLDLSGLGLGDDGIVFLASSLRKNGTLSRLGLERNDIFLKGAKSLADALEKGKLCALAELRLGHNKLGDSGANAVLTSLPKSKALARLDLSKNEISVSDPGAIAAALSSPWLRTLTLRENLITDLGAKKLAAGIAQAKSAGVELNLEQNKIGRVGAIAIAEALEENCGMAVVRLWLAGNEIGYNGRKAVKDLAERYSYIEINYSV